jgi:hypothetical protein
VIGLLLAYETGILELSAGKGNFAKYQWIEWVLLLLVAGVVASLFSIPDRLTDARSESKKVTVPIPASKLVGGAEPFTLGEQIKVVASIPDAQGTPAPKTFTEVEVLALMGKEGAEAVVLLGIPADQAPSLQAALLDDGAHFTYQLLPDRPAPTATVTNTPAPIKSAELTCDSVAFDLPVTKIESDLKGIQRGDVLLVILVEERQDSEGKALEHIPHLYRDVTLLDVLDAKGTGIASPYEGAAEVRVGLVCDATDSSVKEFAGRLAGASVIHLVP